MTGRLATALVPRDAGILMVAWDPRLRDAAGRVGFVAAPALL